MCGICGAVWNEPGGSIDEDQLATMMDRIVHRGPDDSGYDRDDHAA